MVSTEKRDKFSCQFCDKAFEHVSQFVNHTIEHRLKSQVKPLKNRCYKDLKRRAPFRAHMEILHNYAMNDPVFKCDICKKEFKHKIDFVTHTIRHREEPKGRCYICLKRMAGITSLKNHLLIDHTAVKNQCTFCFEIFSKRKFVTRHLKTSHREIYYRFSVTRPISDFSSVELFEIFASNLTHSSQRNEKTGSITETFMKLSCSEIHRFPKREKNEPIATPNLESSQLFSDSSTSRTSIAYSPKRKERNYGPSSYPELDSESAIELSSPKSSEMLKISNRIEISSSETSSCSAFSAYSLSSSSSSSSPTSSPSSSSSFNVKRRISSRSPPSKFGRKFLNPRKRKVTATSSDSNWSHSSSSSSDLSNSPDKSRGVENPGLDLVIYSPLSCSYATLDTSCLLRSPLRHKNGAKCEKNQPIANSIKRLFSARVVLSRDLTDTLTNTVRH